MTPLLKYIRKVVASFGFTNRRSYSSWKEPKPVFSGQRIQVTQECEVRPAMYPAEKSQGPKPREILGANVV